MIENLPPIIKNFEGLKSKFGFPLYAYDSERIRKQYHKIRQAFDQSKLRIHFACKANSNIQILRQLRDLGAEADVVSVNEGKLAELAGFNPEQIHYTPNGVQIDEYRLAIKRNYRISVDNLDIIHAISNENPGKELCIRINPSVMAGGHHKISVGHKRSKFGLPLDQLDEVRQLNEKGKIKVSGLHIHTGSDIKDVEAIKKAALVLMDKAKLFLKHLNFLDFGGGFKVAYHKDDNASDIKSIGSWITKKISSFDAEHKTQLSIVIEPGKYLVSEAGFFLAEVNQTKNVYGTSFVYVNAGFNQFIRPMYYDAYHHITNLSNLGGARKKVDVVGYLCENDNFAQDRFLPEPRAGDVLCFHNAGAYSYTMSSSYNMRERPAEVLFNGQNVKIIQKRQVFKDLINGQVF